MENNKICNWFLYYSKQNFNGFNPDKAIDIESSLVIQQRFCSSLNYFECGRVLFNDFPSDSTGFRGIFDYLVNDKGKVMETLKKEELESYIQKLADLENFSMRHHVTVVKCLMKIYICRLAPWDRIKRALETMGAFIDPETIYNLATFRHAQKCLILWLREAALKGLQKLFRLNKNVSQAQIAATIGNSTTGSLIIYAMVYYVPDRMAKYQVMLPPVDVTRSNDGSMVDLVNEHARIVATVFADICDKKDVLPLQVDCLISKSMDTVPSTLTIALVFHWIFGNTLKNLGNRFKSSITSPNSERLDKIRPSHTSERELNEPRTFFMNGFEDRGESLRDLLSKRKEHGAMANGSLDSVVLGDSSPEVFFVVTEANVQRPGTTPIPAPVNARHVDSGSISEPISLNLKEEYQKKLKQRQNFDKPKDLYIGQYNETTWLAQKNRSEVIPIPLTPKKTVKVPEMTSSNDCVQNLTKAQLNQIQMTLSLSRQKIVSDQRKCAIENERGIEDSKRQIFFQAIGGQSNIIRPRSLESVRLCSTKDRDAADKRLSMYLKRTEQNLGLSPLRRTLSKDKLQSSRNRDSVSLSRASFDGLSVVESRQSPLTSMQDLQQDSLQQEEVVIPEKRSAVEDPESLAQKACTPPMVSVSSDSTGSLYRQLATKDHCHVILSLGSLPQGSVVFNPQPRSWNDGEHSKITSEHNSVAETQTNNGISLTEISDLSKHVPVESTSPVKLESVNVIATLVLPDTFHSPEPFQVQTKVESEIEPCHCLSPILSPDNETRADQLDESGRKGASLLDASGDGTVSPASVMPLGRCSNATSSSESLEVSGVQPVSFVIADNNQIGSDALARKTELLAKKEQRRLLKVEQDKQKREEDRGNKCSASTDDLREREMKKRVEQEKRNVLLRKHLDSKNREKVSGMSLSERRPLSMVDTSEKSSKKSYNQSPKLKGVRRDSAENTSTNGRQKSDHLQSIRHGNQTTSSSTSKLNTNLAVTDNAKFAVPLKTQEYAGPKLFGKKTVKTNRSVIQNAITHCCLAGSVNEHAKDVVLKAMQDLSESDGAHFVILFRDSRCQYRSLYLFDITAEDLSLVTGNGPKRVTHEMVEKFYKYNSGAKLFTPIYSTKHLSTAVDAICIQSQCWNTRPSGQVLSAAVSTTSICQTKNKRPL